jgi:phenylacetate-CoA ligase
MNKHYLKTVRDHLPESIKLLLSPLFRRKLLSNAYFKEYYLLLQKRNELTSKEIYEYQLHQLKYTLQYAFRNVPYYTELFNNIGFNPYTFNDFHQMEIIPFLTKKIIRDNFDSLISKSKVKNGYYFATTGGSTGEPLKVLLDYDSIYKENAFIYYYRSKLGYHFKDRLATFRGIEFGAKSLWKYNPMYNEMIFSPFKLSRKTVHRYLNRMVQFKPSYLNGYLSSIHYFAKLLDDLNIEFPQSIKGIFLISENIDIEQRNFIENYFQAKSSTFYGQSERCVIAEEVEPNLYSFDPYYGYTEFLPIGKGQYQIVGTGFLNETMPLIRYNTYDSCIIHNTMFDIKGRWKTNDVLIGINDEHVFHSAFNFHSDIFKNVMSYQFIQHEKGKVDLLIVVNDIFVTDEITRIRKEIDKKTNGVIDFNIKVVEHLLLTSRGKHQMFINRMN